MVNGVPYTVVESNIGYEALKEAIKTGDWDAVPDLVSPVKVIQKYVKGHFEFVDGVLFEEGVQVRSAIADRMMAMYEEGFPVDPLLAFYKNIKANPSTDSANELYGFLEKNSLPITEDGCFIAYKRVRDDYKDCHSGTIDNSVGKTVSMERKRVNDNRNQTCSSGLHFCSHSYLKSFTGARIVIVKINPQDVVSVPTDYNESKGRCCKYVVIGEMTDEAAKNDDLSKVPVYKQPVINFNNVKTIKVDTIFEAVKALGLRQQALIWNKLTKGTLKKFSYREDVDRRMYSGQFTDDKIVKAAKALKLI